MNEALAATLTRTFRNEPLATVDLPGAAADLTPAQLRSLAGALRRIADDLDARPTQGKRYARLRKEYPLVE